MNAPLDKNGNVIKRGMRVRPCATYKDYTAPLSGCIIEACGELHVSFDGGRAAVTPLSEFRNGDTNYHSVEIVDAPAPCGVDQAAREIVAELTKMGVSCDGPDFFMRIIARHCMSLDAWAHQRRLLREENARLRFTILSTTKPAQ